MKTEKAIKRKKEEKSDCSGILEANYGEYL